MSRNSYNLKRLRAFARRRLFICCLLLATQIGIYLIFILKLRSYIHFYLIASIVSSTLFFIYLSNNKAKNEFKIIWLVPVVVLPVFGISAYVIFSTDRGTKKLRKQLNKIQSLTQETLLLPKKSQELKTLFPEAKAAITYLETQETYPPYSGADIKYYPSGEEFYTDFVNELKKAKHFIFLEYFIIDPDESWNLILKILIDKVLEGVEVRILCDGFGSTTFSYAAYQSFIASKGIKTKVFLPMVPVFTTKQDCRDHRKIAVIDGKSAFTGGLNLSNEYFNYGKNRFNYWKDNAIKVTGPAIRTYTNMFLSSWNYNEKKIENFEKYISQTPKTGKKEGLIIPFGDSPTNNKDIAENLYMHLINTAKEYIYITSPYVIIDNEIKNSLIFAAQRGVDVRIIVPGVPDHFITFCVGRTFMKDLINEGVKIYVYKDFIHAKTVLKDGETACIGSINLDFRSFYHHFECGTYIHKNPVTEDIHSDFEKTFNESTQMTQDSYKKINIIKRAIGRIFRLFSPLL